MIKNSIVISLIFLMSNSSFARKGMSKEIRITACEGKQVGESCSFLGRDQQVQGSCVEGRKDSSIILCHDPNHKSKKRRKNQ